MKYSYLFRVEIPDFESCIRYLQEFVPDYNDRCHCSLAGLTPNEAYAGMTIDRREVAQRVSSARTARIIENQVYNCPTHGIQEVI